MPSENDRFYSKLGETLAEKVPVKVSFGYTERKLIWIV